MALSWSRLKTSTYIRYIQAPALTVVGLSQIHRCARFGFLVFFFFLMYCTILTLLTVAVQGKVQSAVVRALPRQPFLVSPALWLVPMLLEAEVCMLRGRRKSILCSLGLFSVNWSSLVFLSDHLLSLSWSWKSQNCSVFGILSSSNEQRVRTCCLGM